MLKSGLGSLKIFGRKELPISWNENFKIQHFIHNLYLLKGKKNMVQTCQQVSIKPLIKIT